MSDTTAGYVERPRQRSIAPPAVEPARHKPKQRVGTTPDFKKLYVADTGMSHYKEAKSVIRVYDLDGKKLKNGRVFAEMTRDGKTGFADGIRCDEDENVWAGMSWVGDGYDGVHVFAPDGSHHPDAARRKERGIFIVRRRSQ